MEMRHFVGEINKDLVEERYVIRDDFGSQGYSDYERQVFIRQDDLQKIMRMENLDSFSIDGLMCESLHSFHPQDNSEERYHAKISNVLVYANIDRDSKRLYIATEPVTEQILTDRLEFVIEKEKCKQIFR
jgi:hypothetical protein